MIHTDHRQIIYNTEHENMSYIYMRRDIMNHAKHTVQPQLHKENKHLHAMHFAPNESCS